MLIATLLDRGAGWVVVPSDVLDEAGRSVVPAGPSTASSTHAQPEARSSVPDRRRHEHISLALRRRCTKEGSHTVPTRGGTEEEPGNKDELDNDVLVIGAPTGDTVAVGAEVEHTNLPPCTDV